MLNKWIGMGRLARDPDLRHTQSGTPVVSFTIAVDRDFKAQDGDRETDWIDIVAWRSTAEFVSKYFTKGSSIVVEGRLRRDMAAVSRSSMMSLEANLRSSMILMGNYRSKEARNGKE